MVRVSATIVELWMLNRVATSGSPGDIIELARGGMKVYKET